jgi:hypothetical protein
VNTAVSERVPDVNVVVVDAEPPCRWSGGGVPAIRGEARLLRHNSLSMPMSGSLTARRVPLTLSVMLVLNGFLCWGCLRLLSVGSREALGVR